MPGNVLCLTFTNKATENLRLRVRRALAHLELAEGEEPEIQNYHGFAASLLDRYGVLAGFEPDARVLNQAQREELCGRVLDRMTFDHASATYQPSLVAKILELDDQLQNHRVSPAEALTWLDRAARDPVEPPLGALLSRRRGAHRTDAGGRRLSRAQDASSA